MSQVRESPKDIPDWDGQYDSPSGWIDIKDTLPPCDGNRNLSFVMAYHTIYGIGVGWFWVFDEGEIEQIEEDSGCKYLCTCHFIKNKVDGNYCVDDELDIDILDRILFRNLGTITHWMPLPEVPR